jgi:glycosyltransferase involved in cell wall biosynthesis
MTLTIKKRKQVVFQAPLLTQSGYGCHARQVARWLFDREETEQDIEVFVKPLSWGRTPWLLNPNALDGLVGKIIQHSTPCKKPEVSIQLQLPNEWDPFLANYNIGMTAVVETDKCNPKWIDAVNAMDLVIVPSQFCKNTLLASGEVKTEVIVIPESYFDEACQPNNIELDNITTDFNFLVFGQITGLNPENDRKNLFYTVKWIAEAFAGCQNVGVIIKTNLGRNTTIDRTGTQKMLTDLVAQVAKPSGPKFYLLHGEMTNKELSGLYQNSKVKALVSLTRGEGFGLPLLEAAVSGLPVIATGHSAHTEFLGKGKYIKVEYNLAPIHPSRVDNNIFIEGARWAQVHETDARRKLVKFYKSPEVPRKWAEDLKEVLRNEYSFSSIKNKYDQVFDANVFSRSA